MAMIWQFLATPLAHAFMVRGLFAALIVTVVCAVLGTFIVLRGMAFLGDALAHAILPGVAIGYLVGVARAGRSFGGRWLPACSPRWASVR
jgi:manganese/iron transport system permease protein